ncbi:MAG TPA: hypothetical protein V6C78_16390 [Crinalium sp.]
MRRPLAIADLSATTLVENTTQNRCKNHWFCLFQAKPSVKDAPKSRNLTADRTKNR